MKVTLTSKWGAKLANLNWPLSMGLNQLCIRPLDHWSIGPWVECQMLKVNKVNLLSERTSGVPLVIFLGKNLLCTIYQLIILDCVFKNNFLLYKRPCKSRSIEIHFNFQRNTFLCPEKYIFIFREIQFYLQRNTFLFQNCEVCQVLWERLALASERNHNGGILQHIDKDSNNCTESIL